MFFGNLLDDVSVGRVGPTRFFVTWKLDGSVFGMMDL
jgi:hypothetical protein